MVNNNIFFSLKIKLNLLISPKFLKRYKIRLLMELNHIENICNHAIILSCFKLSACLFMNVKSHEL